VLAHPDAVREVFTGDATALHAGKANLILLPFLGSSSVLLLDGAPHLRQRKLMLPPFHGARMAGYQEDVRRIAREHIASWPRDGALKLAPRLQAITLDVVLRVIFGVSTEDAALDELRTRLGRMMDGVMGGPSLLALLAIGPRRSDQLGLFKPILKPVDRLLFSQIEKRRADPGDDVLSLLLAARHEDGSPMSDRELRDELVTLLVAGHETTATALAWAVERLVRTEGGWERLRAGGEEYAEAAGKEALRLRPVLPVVLRHLQRDMTIAGHDLPAGTVVAPCITLVHRRPEIYPEPARFVPERFLGPEPQGGTYTWIPFGGGVRRCIGAAFAMMELKIILAEMAGALELAPARDEMEATSRRTITLVPKRGAEVLVGPGVRGAVS
jgi:cytochrome P450